MHPTMNLIELPPGADPPRLVNAIVEIPATYARKMKDNAIRGSTEMPKVGSKRSAPPPSLGQHNAEVLSEVLGLGEAEIAALEQDGIL